VAYDPPRQTKPATTGDPLEIELVFNVQPCGTCGFFWPQVPAQQPYGPYPAYDFHADAPATAKPGSGKGSFAWLTGTTRPPAFPNAEVMDGCRKAPIMTIGINPNLTAFAPGPAGASWCYPSFSSDDGTDARAKYAFYYRYRSVYQEHFDLRFVRRYLLPRGRIVAEQAGVVVAADRPDDAPGYSLRVRYEGRSADTVLRIRDRPGGARYVLLVDPQPPRNRFRKGDVLAAKLEIPAGRPAKVYAGRIGYYERFVPVLRQFETLLRTHGHKGVRLRMGEDVCQLDMVACASPHWGPPWLGGSAPRVRAIVQNCVQRNAWAIKQLVQTRPAVVFLVGEATWDMFRYALGHLIRDAAALPERPADGAFTLLGATADPAHPCELEFAATVDGRPWSLRTRLVVTPHFSYAESFLPQFRMSPAAWRDFVKAYPDAAHFLQTDARCRLRPPPSARAYAAVELIAQAPAVLSTLRRRWPAAGRHLQPLFYDALPMMAGVLKDLYTRGELAFAAAARGPGSLRRTDGPCSFCVNRHWHFPLGCPYGKSDEPPPPAGFLQTVAADMISSAPSGGASRAAALGMLDDGFSARIRSRL